MEPAVRRLHFAILFPGYAPQRIEIQMPMPSNVPEVLAVVSVYRDGPHRHAFPILAPANPQPVPGSGSWHMRRLL